MSLLAPAFLLGLLTVALFVTTVIFFSQKGAAEKKLPFQPESLRRVMETNAAELLRL